MAILFILYFILSNALSRSISIAILFSRSSVVLFFLCVLLIYSSTQWHFFEKSNSFYNSLLYFDFLNIALILFIILLVVIILCLTSYYPCDRKQSVKELSQANKLGERITKKLTKMFQYTRLQQTGREHYKIIEYPLIIQFIIIGSITLSSCNDVITMFLCIELQSYGLYILSSIYRNSESSTGGGLTYFLLGGLSSCIILLGQSFIYINSGLTGLDGLYVIQNIMTSDTNYIYTLFLSIVNNNTIIFTLDSYHYELMVSFIVLSVGFLFKISAAPFHSWSPGVYDAIPTVTTTFVAIIPKISILVLLFDLVYNTGYSKLQYSWTNILLYSSYLSLIIGSLLGLTQIKIKRLYAYSTISHVGFILLALCVQSVESLQAFFFYIIQYSLSNVNAFFILIVIGYIEVYYKATTRKLTKLESQEIKPEPEKTKSESEKTKLESEKTESEFQNYLNEYKEKLYNLSPIEFIDQLKGYMYLNPILVLSFSVTLYSFIGVPPLVGFFAKQMVLSSALDHGNIFMCIIAIVTSVISAVYYLYIIKHMVFEKNTCRQWASIIPTTSGRVHGSTISTKSNLHVKELSTPSNILLFIISILTFISILFIFLYYEIYFLMNTLSVILIC